jgi:HlyD family secretion protein
MKFRTIFFVGVPVLALSGYAFLGRSAPKDAEIEYRYAPVERGELLRSISSTGQVVALTSVDVKSKAGGKVVKLLVDEGSVVHKGQLVAIIDPADTKAVVDQADADLQSAVAHREQAEKNLELQIAQSRNDVADARAALAAAKIRLDRAKLQADRQPSLTKASINQSRAAYESAQADLDRMNQVTIPQATRDAAVNLNQATAQRDTAVADLKRQEELAAKGYVSGAALDKARSDAEVAKTAYETAKQRASTITQEIDVDRRSMEKARDRTKASLEQAQASASDNEITKTALDEASRNVESAQVTLQKAIDNQLQNDLRRSDVVAARAATVHNRVSAQNAKVQLDSTTVVAPRDGVVTLKYLEEGTIIPPGESTFAQGTSLVQISDVTQLFVECLVDEADVASVKLGQAARIIADAYREIPFDGIVTRISPAAITANNVTTVKVRVKVLPGAKARIVPGMNATCEFITMQRKNVLLIPAQALQDDGTVRVQGKDPKKPEVRKISVGETGNESVEVLSGLKAGEQVVTAEIDLAMLRETQEKMKAAEEGGGLAGGGPNGGKKKKPAAVKK